jgi:hypothetical protein
MCCVTRTSWRFIRIRPIKPATPRGALVRGTLGHDQAAGCRQGRKPGCGSVQVDRTEFGFPRPVQRPGDLQDTALPGCPTRPRPSAADGFAGPGSVVTAGQAGAFPKATASPADSSLDRSTAVYEEAHRWGSAWAGLGQGGPRRQQRAAPPASRQDIRPAVPSTRVVDAGPVFRRPRVPGEPARESGLR